MKISEELKRTVGRALGRVPSGVFVLTAAHDGEQAGNLVSWVQQAGFEPPAITVAVAKDRPILRLIRSCGRFGISVLGEHDHVLMKTFARGRHGPEAFANVATVQTPGGVACLSEALAVMELELTQVVDLGWDHVLLAAQVSWGQCRGEAAPFTHTRSHGFHY